MPSFSSSGINKRSCPICGGSEHQVLFQLESTPLGDRFTESEAEALLLPRWPIEVVKCIQCNHCYHPYLTDPDDIYLEYLFVTSQSPGLVESFKEIVFDIISRRNLSANDIILDIGGNDGSWLGFFSSHGCNVVAVEPAPIPAKLAMEKGIPVIQDYFSEKSLRASNLVSKAPRIISLNYIFANISQPMAMLQEIADISDENTIVSFLTGYHPAQLAVSMFDYINHDHLSYFSCSDFSRMANSIGFIVTYAREVPLKGGSIHIEMQRIGEGRKQSELFSTMLKREMFLNQPANVQWRQTKEKICHTRDLISSEISVARDNGLTIIGYGASISTTTLLYALGIESMIDFVVDDNPSKCGRFSPGTAVPVMPSKLINSELGACVILLAWQHGPRIRQSLKSSGFKGQVITPFPTFTIEQL